MIKLKSEAKQQVKVKSKKIKNPLLWFLFLAEQIKPNSHNWVTKLLGRPRQCIHKFKTTRKYRKLEEQLFKPYLNSYINGQVDIEEASNSAQRYMIQYLIQKAQNSEDKTSFEQFLIKLNFLISDLQKWNQKMYDEQDQEVKGIQDIYFSDEDQNSYQAKEQNINDISMNQQQLTQQGKSNQSKKFKKTFQVIKFKSLKAQYLTQALDFTIFLGFNIVNKLNKIKQNHQNGLYATHQVNEIYQGVKDFAVSQKLLLQASEKIIPNSSTSIQ